MAQISLGIAAWRATGAAAGVPYQLTLLAEAHSLFGQVDEAFQLLDDAQALLEQQGDRYNEAEIYRRRGEFVIAAVRIQ